MANLQDIVNRSEVGAIKPWTKSTAPAGYLLCDGSAVSRSTYADLFAVVSTTYGSGDGSTTFNVPNLQGKMPQGYDGNTYNLAGTGGANTVTVAVTNNQAATNATNQAVTITGSISNTSLTSAQLASHSHNFNASTTQNSSGSFPPGGSANHGAPPSPGNTGNTGSGSGHNHAHTLSGSLTGNITTSLTGDVTAAGTNSFSPFVVVNYIIKH
jgi:microcystin-dependent protein